MLEPRPDDPRSSGSPERSQKGAIPASGSSSPIPSPRGIGAAEGPAAIQAASSSASTQPEALSPAELTRRSRSSFYYAFLFLDKSRREALDAVYSFCRLVDDAADESPTPAAALENLARWRSRIESIYRKGSSSPVDSSTGSSAGGTAEDKVVQALFAAVRNFPLLRADLDAVIEGCEWDATRHRYETWDELRAYCLRVASAVGLLCIEIFGYRDPRARDYAVDLGLALQLTNILRDVAEDAARGRIYLPLEDLRAFGVEPRHLIDDASSTEKPRSERVLRLLRFEAQRARLHFLRARAYIDRSERDRLVVAEIMGDIYYALLERIEADGFPRGRSSLSATRKAALAVRRFLSARLRETLS